MKWVVFCVLVGLARYGEGGALRSLPKLQDATYSKAVESETSIESTSEEREGETKECLAGSTWESNCHHCTCSVAGVALCLRQPSCDQGVIAEPIKCKPNTTFARDCNTCTCYDGLVLCTLKYCAKSIIPKKSELKEGRECAPGTLWRNQCNECKCSPHGYSFCTEKACDGQDSGTKTVMRCAPDTMWKNDCNTCWCTSDGLPLCTKIGCVDLSVTTNAEGNTDTDHSEADEQIESNYDHIEDQLKHIEEPDPNLEEYDNSENHQYKLNTKDLQIAESHYNIEQQAINTDDSDGNVIEYGQDAIVNNNNKLSHVVGVRANVYHTVIKRSVCKANQVFQSECNSCKCAADGQSYKCTQNECMEGETNKEVEVFMEDEGGDHIERHSVCKPRGTFYIGCNTCHCNLYGTDYSCTNKPCPLPEDVELFHELKDLRIIKKECRPDEVFELDCNMCRCNSDGKSFSCTRRACVEPVDEDKRAKNSSISRKTRAVAQDKDVPKTCQPGQEFRMDCNKCLCDNEGQDFSCTRNDCNAVNNNNGGVRSRRETDPYFLCNPGMKFKRDCNDCTCSSDGKSASCTERICDQSISSPSL